MGAADFIERRMASELDEQGARAGHDLKRLRALDRAHKKWEQRFPAEYRTYMDARLKEAAEDISKVLDFDIDLKPNLRLIRSKTDY